MPARHPEIPPCLEQSPEPALQYRLCLEVLGETQNAGQQAELRESIKDSPLVRQLLSERDAAGEIPRHPYTKWIGAHWVLASLADLEYPPGDQSLKPLSEQVCRWLLGDSHRRRIKSIDGRIRRCASQEGNAVYSLLKLGLADDRVQNLVQDLIAWQWPDGGWNCDKNPEAVHSSFMESLIPMRALALHGQLTGDSRSSTAAKEAASIFLGREMFRRQQDGSVIAEDFTLLHFPCYWHYDILFGLKVMAEAGMISDPRCQAALDLLESKRLPDGGFPAEGKYFRASEKAKSGRSTVDWGGVNKRQSNPFVSLDALSVLKRSGRLTQ